MTNLEESGVPPSAAVLGFFLARVSHAFFFFFVFSLLPLSEIVGDSEVLELGLGRLSGGGGGGGGEGGELRRYNLGKISWLLPQRSSWQTRSTETLRNGEARLVGVT